MHGIDTYVLQHSTMFRVHLRGYFEIAVITKPSSARISEMIKLKLLPWISNIGCYTAWLRHIITQFKALRNKQSRLIASSQLKLRKQAQFDRNIKKFQKWTHDTSTEAYERLISAVSYRHAIKIHVIIYWIIDCHNNILRCLFEVWVHLHSRHKW